MIITSRIRRSEEEMSVGATPRCRAICETVPCPDYYSVLATRSCRLLCIAIRGPSSSAGLFEIEGGPARSAGPVVLLQVHCSRWGKLSGLGSHRWVADGATAFFPQTGRELCML